tara:strand:- start:205 stop:378 length:174 start_codon:yes stop_codon:yes gene_type:complete
LVLALRFFNGFRWLLLERPEVEENLDNLAKEEEWNAAVLDTVAKEEERNAILTEGNM